MAKASKNNTPTPAPEQVQEKVAPTAVENVAYNPVQTIKQTLGTAVNKAMHRARTEQKTLYTKLKAEGKVKVKIAPSYAAHFGKQMRVSLGGIAIYVPCNGRPYEVPESFAREINGNMAMVDEAAAKQARMADIERNSERTPGEIIF